MKILFENEYQMETKYFKEYVYKSLLKNLNLTCFITLFTGILLYYFMPSNISYIILITSIIIFIFGIFLPVVTIKELEKTEKKLNNGKIEKTNIIFSDNIVMTEGKTHLEFEYSQITKIQYTKNFIVLKISQQSAILVFKNGFLKGNEPEFIKFITEKINK